MKRSYPIAKKEGEMTLHFISGASDTGKTSIIPYLKKLLEKEVAVHDFDDIGVPNNLDNKWRQKSTNGCKNYYTMAKMHVYLDKSY